MVSDDGPTTTHQRFGATPSQPESADPAPAAADPDDPEMLPTTKHQRRGPEPKPPQPPVKPDGTPQDPKWMVWLLMGTIVVTVFVIALLIGLRYGGGGDDDTQDGAEQSERR